MSQQRPGVIPKSVQITLRDGAIITLRAIDPRRTDEPERILAFGRRLSEESLQMRFFSVPKISEHGVRIVLDVDHCDRLAIAAVEHDEIVAIGRYARDEKRPQVGHIAFIVQDDRQGCGIGTALLHHLVRLARRNGITEFEGDLYPENRKMLEVLLHAGYPARRRFRNGLLCVGLDIADLEPDPAEALDAMVT